MASRSGQCTQVAVEKACRSELTLKKWSRDGDKSATMQSWHGGCRRIALSETPRSMPGDRDTALFIQKRRM
jgi:hypothetical protein